MITSTSGISGSASRGIRPNDQTPAIATPTRKRNTRNRLLLHQSIVLLITGALAHLYCARRTLLCSAPLALHLVLTFHLGPTSKAGGWRFDSRLCSPSRSRSSF